MTETINTKVLIIGSGPAGYTAAIYAARAGHEPVMITGLQTGGQLTTTTEIENWPGFENPIEGSWLMEQMAKQAENMGTKIMNDLAISVDFSAPLKKVIGDSGNVYTADTVIITTGAQARWFGMESEEKFKNNGVSACAKCDGFFYRGKEVAVLGGGNSAVEEAIYLTNFAKKVTLIHRRDELRAEKVMQERLFKNPKIEVIWDTEVEEFLGDDMGLSGLRLKNKITGKVSQLNVMGAFVSIGHKPATEIFQSKIKTDAEGYIITDPDSTATNVPGVFAAGDVKDKKFRQAITAAGMGCMAALEADKYLMEK